MVSPFKVIVDASLVESFADLDVTYFGNKHICSLVNGYEGGSWRQDAFLDFVWDNIAETALSAQERSALAGRPGSTLRQAAMNLRLTESTDDIGSGSELAEIVLYGVMKHKYGALPVVPKIYYKQNVNDNAKGADCVHITIDAEGGYSLWFGEAKFYKSIESAALSKVVASVKASLEVQKLKKENGIIRNVSDIDMLGLGEDLVQQIKSDLTTDKSIDEIRGKINIPILLLHECPITAGVTQYSEEYTESVRKHHLERAKEYFGKQYAQMSKIYGYIEMTFHLILIPVPSKSDLVERFMDHARANRGRRA